MGKWNKGPPQVSQQFLQNQQRRKQMIIQAAKRRKQKQKKLQQQAQIQKKEQQQAIIRHRQQKKDAYVKYLRNNMHDKYQEMKRHQKVNQPEVHSKSKWKKDNSESNLVEKNQNNLEGLNLEFHMENKRKSLQKRVYNKVGGQVVRNQPIPEKNIQFSKLVQKEILAQAKRQNNFMKKQNQPKVNQKRRMLENQFQDMWKQQHEQQENPIDYDLSIQDESLMDDMIGSKLLDSLDLDFGTVNRAKKIDKKIKQESKNFNKMKQSEENKELKEIKNMIGYESVLMSIDQRSEMMKKYNQFMKNQVQTNEVPEKKKDNQISKKSDSRDVNNKNNVKKGKQTLQGNRSKEKKQVKPEVKQKPINQRQYFNQLKNKKQGKILNWANQEAQQADDLFSNCSTNKKSRTRGFQMLKQINKQIQSQNIKISSNTPTGSSAQLPPQQVNMKKKDRALETIPERKLNVSRQKLRQRSFDKKNQQKQSKTLYNPAGSNNKSHEIKRSTSQQKINEASKNRTQRIISGEDKKLNSNINIRVPRQLSKQKANKTATNRFQQNKNVQSRMNNNNQNRPRSQNRRSLSHEKQNYQKSSKQIPKSNVNSYGLKKQPVGQNNANNALKKPHFPPTYQPKSFYQNDQITVCTQDQRFQVESFIKNQLLVLNKQQRQLQQDLKNIHIQNKDKIKQIQVKHQIKTNYKHSYEIERNEDGQQIEDQIQSQASKNSYGQIYKKQTESQLEESIQRLDDMLFRKQILQKQKNSRITQEDNQSSSTARSIINPMSDPITLHKQVLQLAQNLSRFEGQPQNIEVGYGAKLRMKKKSVQKQKSMTGVKKSQISRDTKIQKNKNPKKQTEIDLSQSQDVNYSQLNSNINSYQQSKVSRPPQLGYMNNYNANTPYDINTSDLLDDVLEDSIQKGKIQVDQRLKKMLLD